MKLLIEKVVKALLCLPRIQGVKVPKNPFVTSGSDPCLRNFGFTNFLLDLAWASCDERSLLDLV